MSSPLAGADIKLARVTTHLVELSRLVATYEAQKPYKVSVLERGTEVLVEVQVMEQPSPEWGAIVGDCLVNARAALDYAAWDLAAKFGGASFSPKDTNLYFPLGTAPNDLGYTNGVGTLRKYRVPSSALAAVDAAGASTLRCVLWSGSEHS